MTTHFRFWILTCLVLTIGTSQAQVFNISSEKSKWMQKNLNRISISADSSYKQGQKLAQKLGYKLTDSLGKGKLLRFHSINPQGEPLYLVTHSTTQAGKMTKTNSLYKNGSLGLEITGNSDLLKGKLGMWDGGALLDAHVEFTGRTSKQSGQTSTLSSHATHVAGIMIAAGKNANVLGMASDADLKYWDFDNDASEIATASKDLYVSNHSYGIQAGWVYDENRSKWTWWGYDASSKTEDYKFGVYDDNTRQLDQIAYNAPNYLVVKSAGNSRGDFGPDTSTTNKNYFQKYYIRNTSTLDSIPRNRNTGYDIISTNANAKNILTVGALESSLILPRNASSYALASYSAWGPTDDGRIKPDIMGIGSNIYSTTNTSSGTANNLYEYNSGTSMSSPQVAGSLLLLQQLYTQLNKGAIMRASTLKGLAIHSAMDIGAVGPDYKTGWGVLNMENAGKILQNAENNHVLSELTLKNGESYKINLVASGKGPLTATISWTDPEGKSQGTVLNDRTPRLVNDLDIRIKESINTYLPFILDPNIPEKLATKADNFRDNVEKIIIPDAIPGKTYELTISHKGTLTYAAQDYGLIVSGVNGKMVCAVNSSNTGYIKQVKLNNQSSNYQIESGLNTPVEISTEGLTSGFINAFVDWNQDGDFEDVGEWIQNNASFSNSLYSFKINSPGTIIPQNNYGLRLFVSSQTIANACTSPSNGEIKDVAITALEPSYDVSVDKLIQSGGAFCAGSNNLFYGTIRNSGTKSITNFNLKFSIFEEGLLKKTYTKAIDSLSINEQKEISFLTDLSIQNDKNYRYELAIDASNDQVNSNNILSKTQLLSNSVTPKATGLSCSNSSTINLSANLNAFWYDSNNTLLGYGTNISLPKTGTYFASQGGVSQSLGPKTKYEFGTGTYYSNFGPEPILEVKSPMVLESARVYVGTKGTIDFYVTDMNSGELVSFSSINVNATRSQKNIVAPPNQISDDKSDQGTVIYLNLEFPKAGKYQLTQVCKNGASIFRSNRTKADTINAPNNIGFPYNSNDNLISMTGAMYQGAPIYSGYYYFYDMKFKSIGCSSDKSAVSLKESIAPSLSLTSKGPKSICPGTETINLGVTANTENIAYQWQRNGNDIAGATKTSYTPTTSGTYSVKGTNVDGCFGSSDTYSLTIFPNATPNIYYNLNGLLETTAVKNIQWYLNDKLLAGINTNTFTPTTSGVYKVQGNDVNGCFGVSMAQTVTILGTENESLKLKIYPNPTEGNQLILQVPNELLNKNYTVEIVDLSGQRKIVTPIYAQSSGMLIDIRHLETGVYFLRILELEKEKSIKFIKN